MSTTQNVPAALVTGASEGIGRAFAHALAREGYRITAVARNQARLEELVRELGPGGHHALPADLGTPAGVAAVTSALEARYALLVNNAGIGKWGAFHEVPLEETQAMLRLNCEALVTLSHAYLQTARQGDALVNVSSVLGFLPFPAEPLYAATKALVLSLTESLWYQNRDRGVYVMALCPGATQTLFAERAGSVTRHRPQSMIQTPEAVVAEALLALRRRTAPVVVTGGKNRAVVALPRILPRAALVSLMGRAGRK